MSQTEEESFLILSPDDFDKLDADKKKQYLHRLAQFAAQVPILQSQVTSSQSFAREQMTENAELQNKYSQVVDKVEGLLSKGFNSDDLALRKATDAWEGHRDLREMMHHLAPDHNWLLPILLAVIVLVVVIAIFANPAYAIPFGTWIQTTTGTLTLIALMVLSVVAIYFLTRKR